MIPNLASEQLASAIRYMTCSSEPLQKRLLYAYAELEPLIAADFPGNLGKSYLEIISRLTKTGSVNGTIDAMSDEEALEISLLILDLFSSVKAASEDRPVSRSKPTLNSAFEAEVPHILRSA